MGAFTKLKTLIFTLKIRELAKRYCYDRAKKDVVLVSGSGRSGTSWVANICNFQNDFRYIFEPLNPEKIELGIDDFNWCLNEQSDAPLLSSILDGHISNSWANSRNKRLIAKRRLIKEIRSNTMLKWVSKHYPKVKVVVVLRNPLAVAASRKRLEKENPRSNWVWLPSVETLLKEPQLKESISHEQFELLAQQVGKGVVMETMADWCINNLLAFNLSEQPDWYVVYYEELLADGDAVASGLMEFLGISIKKDIQAALSQSSETTRLRNSVSVEWFDVLSADEIDQATMFLQAFGVDKLYSKSWAPLLKSGQQADSVKA